MRLTSPTIPTQTAKAPQTHHTDPRFGYYISPSHPQNTTSDANATSSESALALRDVGVLMWAILLAIPSLAFGAYKFSTWYAKRSHNRHMNQRHEQLLTQTEAGHRSQQDAAFRLEQLRHPQNAVIRDR